MSHSEVGQTISVPSEFVRYIAFMHDAIACYHQRLTQVVSPKVANLFLAQIADRAAVQLGLSKEADPKRAADAFLEALGMRFKTLKVGEKTVTHIACPYAAIVHPKLAGTTHLCPASIIELGAERLSDNSKLIVEYYIDHGGSHYTIASSD